MKKCITFVLSLLCLFTYAQILSTNEGVVIEDGDIIGFSELDEEMKILVTNNTNENIFTKIMVETITNNADGSNLQLCYGGICLSQIQEGAAYPSSPVVITPGRTNNQFDHLVNNYAGDNPEEPVSYVLKFVLLDSSTLEIIEGSEITFTYLYDENLSTQDVSTSLENKLLKNSIVTNALYLSNDSSGVLKIYNTTGILVSTQKVSAYDAIQMQAFNRGNYIAVFESENGKVATQKFVKK